MNGSLTLLSELSLDLEDMSSDDDSCCIGVKPGEFWDRDGDCGLKISEMRLSGLKLRRPDAVCCCCRMDRGVIASVEDRSPVSGVETVIRLRPVGTGRPEDCRMDTWLKLPEAAAGPPYCVRNLGWGVM